jgi:hypothetical protein
LLGSFTIAQVASLAVFAAGAALLVKFQDDDGKIKEVDAPILSAASATQ